MIRTFLRAVVIAAACVQGSESGAQNQCTVSDPSSSVYEVLNSHGVKQGAAVLVDADQGIFITALHFLGVQGLVLSKGNENNIPFTPILSGSNSRLLYDDWAIVTTGRRERNRQSIHLIYDIPNGVVLSSAKVINSSSSVGNIGSVRWDQAIYNSKECAERSTVVLRIDSYDKGDSGSPIYSPEQCGVVGITSRFILPEDANTPAEKEAVDLFLKFSGQIPVGSTQEVENEPTLEGKYKVVRQILLDHIFVKIVPSKCIVDNVVEKTFLAQDQKVIDALDAATRPDVKAIIEDMEGVNPYDLESVDGFVSVILGHDPLRWPEIVNLWNRFYRGVMADAIKTGTFSPTMKMALDEISRERKYAMVYTIYDREKASLQSIETPSCPPSCSGLDGINEKYGLNYNDFIKLNAGWAPRPTLSWEKKIPNLKVGGVIFDDQSADTSVTAGLELVRKYQMLATDKQSDPKLVSFYRDAATQMLTAGMSRSFSNWSTESSASGRAMVGLAELMSASDFQPVDLLSPLHADDPARKEKVGALAYVLAEAGAENLVGTNDPLLEKSEVLRSDISNVFPDLGQYVVRNKPSILDLKDLKDFKVQITPGDNNIFKPASKDEIILMPDTSPAPDQFKQPSLTPNFKVDGFQPTPVQ